MTPAERDTEAKLVVVAFLLSQAKLLSDGIEDGEIPEAYGEIVKEQLLLVEVFQGRPPANRAECEMVKAFAETLVEVRARMA